MLTYSLLTSLGFAILVAWIIYARAGLAYFFYILPAAYLGTLILVIHTISSSRKAIGVISLILMGSALITGATFALTASHGYPVSYYAYQGYNSTCSTVKVQNASSPNGYTNSTICTSTPTASQSSPVSIVMNFVYWLPVSGLAVSTVPTFAKGQTRAEKSGYGILSLVLLVALLLPLTGLLPLVGS